MIKKYFYYWTPAISLMMLIFILSSFSTLPAPENIIGFDKMAHFGVYLILSLLFYRAFSGTTDFTEKKIIILSIFFTGFYGLTDELHQHFVPGRDASVYDLLFDFLGAVAPYNRFFVKMKEVVKK